MPANIYLRPRPRDLGAPPLDLDLLQHARLVLKPRELGVWLNLYTHLWVAGDLPVATRALSRIAGVGHVTFEKMMPALGELFDHHESGRWGDVDLEEERSRRLDEEPGERLASTIDQPTRRIDPALSEARRQAGARGGRSRVERLKLIQGGRVDADDAQAKSAKIQANRQANGDALPDGFASSLPSFASAVALGSPGSIDRSSSLDFQEKTINQSERAGEGDASKTASKTVHAAEAKPGIAAQAKSDDDLQANLPAPASQTPVAIADVALIEAVRGIEGGKIPAILLNPRDIAPLRGLIEDRCDLVRDILPAVANFAMGCKGPLRSFGAAPIREKAMASRDRAERSASAPGLPANQIFVVVDTPEWRAWTESRGGKPFPIMEHQRKRGWFTDTRWPPGIDARLYDQTLAQAARSG